MERETPHDAWVCPQGLPPDALPAGSVVGTSSLRREAQLRATWPHLVVHPLRGNLQTRLAKLDDGQYQAIVLAAAGLQRLGLAERITATLSAEQSLPAPGQGALGLEILAERQDMLDLLRPLQHPATTACVHAERAMSLRLNGSCETPLGAYAEVMDAHFLRLRGFVASPDGSRFLRAESNGTLAGATALGRQVADLLLSEGAGGLLARPA